MNQKSDVPTDSNTDRPVPALRREVIYGAAGPQKLLAVAIVTALASVSFGFALALFARPMGMVGHCPTVRVVERAVPLAHAPRDVAWLGVYITTEKQPGALVLDVIEGTPAEAAGLRGGDRIVGLDDTRVRSSGELVRAVRARSPGESVTVKFRRGDQLHEVTTALDRTGPEPRVRPRLHR